MADNNQKNRERQIRFVYRKIDTSVHQLRFSIHQLYTNFGLAYTNCTPTSIS